MGSYIYRTLSAEILECQRYYQVITITGPRQVGKTTLCRNLFPDYSYYNLEDISLRTEIERDPKNFFAQANRHVIIDEIQTLPSLLSYIMVYVDSDQEWRFVLTGSCNISLLNTISQSLCGRTAVLTLLPLSLDEVPDYKTHPTDEILFNGFYPALFDKQIPATKVYANYYTAYVERDIRQLLKIKDLTAFQTFIRLCAGRVGAECNLASLSNEVGVSSVTLKEWLSILEASYIVFRLHPYYTNISKRLVKTPKLYFYDTGLLCYLLGLQSADQLASHPLRGGVFENMVVLEMLKYRYNRGLDSNLFFYRESHGTEIDIVAQEGNDLRLYEVKFAKTSNPDFYKNIHAVEKLFGERIASSCVVYDGDISNSAMHSGLCNFRQLNSGSLRSR